MQTIAEIKQLSPDDRASIERQVKADLIDHLYAGCLPGTVSGLIVSVALFLDYYGYTETPLLIAWLIAFNTMMIALSTLFFAYKRLHYKFSLRTWEWAYSILMCGCALVWIPSIYLLPDDITRQYLGLIALFMATTGYAMGTIGQFSLCVTTLTIMLTPLIAWCLSRGGLFYDIIAAYTTIYMAFMFSINYRSTRWFKESLKLKLENMLVSHQANHDMLTDLPNQRLLPRFIESAMKLVSVNKNIFCVVCFSLNRMEMITDSLGHEASNVVIQTIATRLNRLAARAARNKNDTQFFIGISRKDTFYIILAPLLLEELDEYIKKLFSVLDEPVYLEQKGVKLTASVGVSIFPKDGNNAQTLLKNAEASMLQAKQFGGDRTEFYRVELNAQIPRQLELETDLRDALAKNKLELYYQPLIDLRSGQICGMEALLRWPHPVRGFISPNQFIPLAEQTGLIIPIGEWVLREACKQTRIWHQMGFPHLKVAVNLAEKQLRQENIVTVVSDILIETKFDPRFLELEITETGILDESVVPTIKAFKKLGLSLSVDDFGTGYSGLSYLKRFSIDKLKIDQSFIRDLPANNDSVTIVSAILAMAKELHVLTLAEGVETAEQLKFLQQKGCNYAQGYYFSKPLEKSFFSQLLLSLRSYESELTRELIT